MFLIAQPDHEDVSSMMLRESKPFNQLMQQHCKNTAVLFVMLPKPPVPPNAGDDDEIEMWATIASNYVEEVWQFVADLPPVILTLPSKKSDSQIFTTSL
jgi:hypothetical protein